MTLAAIMCRCRRNRLLPIKSTFTGRRCTNLAIGRAAKTRLARDQSGRFGSALYAREELCAELASAFLCAALGIVPTVRHADYLGSWLAVLRQDNRAIFKAASQASKAADFCWPSPGECRSSLARAA
jgi:antirestriction protein ArdC